MVDISSNGFDVRVYGIRKCKKKLEKDFKRIRVLKVSLNQKKMSFGMDPFVCFDTIPKTATVVLTTPFLVFLSFTANRTQPSGSGTASSTSVAPTTSARPLSDSAP